MTSTPLIRITNLSRSFKNGGQETPILKGLNLDIYAGEMVAIIGQSGSGKSTLMNILGCLDRPSSGEYFFAGENLATLSPERRATLRREHIGFIFQRYHLLEHLKAWENVAIPAVYAGEKQKTREARAKTLLTRLGLEKQINHRPNQMSGGQQQRVSIARALINGGQIIFADEPTGALDSQSGAEVMAILRELNAAGHTIVLVTHDQAIAAQADRVVTILDGEIISDERQKPRGEPTPLPKQAKTSAFYFGRLASAFSMATRAIFSHKLRAFLTMLGIIIGIASVVSVVALGQGSQQQILKSINDLGVNTIRIYAGQFGRRSQNPTRDLTSEDAQILSQQEFIATATPFVDTSATLIFADQDFSANVSGIGTSFFAMQNFPIVSGRYFLPQDIETRAAVAIIDENGAREIFTRSSVSEDNPINSINPINPIGKIIRLNNVPFRIVGVVRENNQRHSNSINVYLPYSAALSRILGNNQLSGIIVQIKDSANTTSAEDAIKRILIRRHGGEDFTLINNDSIRKAITDTTNALALLIAAIAAIALVVGGIGVMNIMLVSVTERTREIGIRMAVGARKGDILGQFLIESILLCLLGGALGVGLAFALGELLKLAQAPLTLIYSTTSVIVAFSCSTAIGIIFGYLPASHAAALDPVEALSRD